MTAPGGGAGRSDPTRIGGARPSHLITTAGIGAVIDLPSMSVIVRGLDTWAPERAEAIAEPRLLSEVQRVLGGSVRAMRKAPWDPADADNGYARTGVPVSPFPRWVRCPRCHRLGPLDPPGQFTLVHRYGRRPDLAKWVHSGCQHQRQADHNRRSCQPARFLAVCDAGHLDDFPYVAFAHHGTHCDGPKLTMTDSASTLSPRVTIRCEECGASRNIQDAAGRDGWEHLPRCRGRHPHLQHFEACGRRLRLMVLGSSNLWFSVTASALHLPQERTVAAIVAANWAVLSAQPTAVVVQMLVDAMADLRDLRSVPVGEVWAAIEQLRASGGPTTAEQAGGELRNAEWEMLSRPTTDRTDGDFRAVPTPAPAGYEALFDQVVRVSRLRVVSALVGFTRLAAPERSELTPANRLPLSQRSMDWVPAVEQRGEGVFLQLREDVVARWEAAASEHPRITALRAAYLRWCANRDQQAQAGFPAARYTLLHTLSHLLIRQVSLECGYSSAAIRERLYVGDPGRRTAGVVLSTAASDSEGTLGGVVALGEARHLGRLLDLAFADAERCSSDPLCAEHVPQAPADSLHAAACHACLFASETSCEANNRWLDRAV
ncbi:MAG: DUF1998 domain-containing protein, partial [Actinomycetota bacterium]|nr:DUF1998 domain-containing protein [Actinomycetota bacterium]